MRTMSYLDKIRTTVETNSGLAILVGPRLCMLNEPTKRVSRWLNKKPEVDCMTAMRNIARLKERIINFYEDKSCLAV